MPTAPVAQTTPLMSFIITSYDIPADMLRKCISTVLSLTLRPDEREVIVIDDGSKMPAIVDLDDVKDRVVYLRQPNMGPACARNMGLRVATGRYIQFVDGDDYLERVPYEHCIDLVRYHNPDVLVFDFSNHGFTSVPYTFEGPMQGAEYMKKHNVRGTSCLYIFSRQTLGNLRFTPGVLHEDEEFAPLLILRAERLFYTDAKAYCYRKRSGSIMHEQSASHLEKRFADALAIILRLQEQAATMPEAEHMALNRRVAQLTMDYLYNVIHLTHSRKCLHEAMHTLANYGLYPLPNKKYTFKYSVFRRLMQSAFGRQLLLYIIG